MNVDVPVLEMKQGHRGLFVKPVIVTYRCFCEAQKVERV